MAAGVLGGVLGLVPAARGAVLSPRIANYVIAARYDVTSHTISGHEVLHWRNATAEAASELRFHLYLNAFANNRSSFMREAGEMWARWQTRHPHGWGYMTIQSLHAGGIDVTKRTTFMHPDDGNIDDRTVLRVPLEKPLAPGASIDVVIDFEARLPKVVARSGYAGPFAMVAQWFPKIGVFRDGQWQCHQYHLTTEFFADFGVYDVTLTVPRDLVIGATGVLHDVHENDGTKTMHFVAEDVHDFAWAADPRFRVMERQLGGTNVTLLCQPGHLGQAERYLQGTQVALAEYERLFGAYPYPQLTIVDPAPGAFAAAGMEYPTLVTAGSIWWTPRGFRLPEMITIHELGHQYWYGMVANDEALEPWLDEGINSYVEGRIMDAAYGRGSYLDLLGFQVGSVAINRLQYARAAQHDPVVRPGWQFMDRASYSAISYAKTALVLDTLAVYIGDDTLMRGLRGYFQRWRFRHPSGPDFVHSIEESAGQDLSWYFDQVLSGSQVLDYAVTKVRAERLHGAGGYRFTGPEPEEEDDEASNPPERRYRSEVVVERLGGIALPVDVHITFDDGSISTEHWDGKDRWKRFEYTGQQRVEWAVVQALPLDVNWLNNSRMRAAGTRGLVRIAGRWGFWFQNLLAVLTGW